ncbi:hypothetical protein WGE86_21445 [Xanthomonas euvesicatoria pv. euvesicatoria]|uniref:hypothetical protein n=1 Tax=Xanthomonas TaxID=338 RepID=UPI001E4C9707|nr:hypothetical protein [Xanthomonas euvesicatoria]MCC8547764.1 hypothetical protein [Xanthomonas euvesicatoria pv. euvesicatoria]MCC8612545.1 hypothetical protein [Xanthomonas euvesicatoria pv. euvesicatoria]
MSEQFGFDFGGAAKAFALHEPGTWLNPEYTVEQYHAMFASGAVAVRRIVGPARGLFLRGLAVACNELEKMVERCSDHEPRHLWRVTCALTDDEFVAFVAHCRAMVGSTLDGIEYKVWDEDRCVTTAAMYVRDVGTLIAWRWSKTNRAIDFQPWRNTFSLESYRDGMQAIEASYATWGHVYCADKLANSNDGITSVPTFVVHGREYINDGGFSCGPYRECEG